MRLDERFWSRVDKTHECWVWKGTENGLGYGVYRADGKAMAAHRASFLHFKREIPEGLVIDHLCGNRACVNPLHLEAVTRRVNTLRARGRLQCDHRDGRGAPCDQCIKIHCSITDHIKDSGGSIKYYANRKWRHSHTETRNAGRKRYYDQFIASAVCSRVRWTSREVERIITADIPDRNLAAELGRSVRAIQIKRTKIKARKVTA